LQRTHGSGNLTRGVHKGGQAAWLASVISGAKDLVHTLRSCTDSEKSYPPHSGQTALAIVILVVRVGLCCRICTGFGLTNHAYFNLSDDSAASVLN
jgi:Aldose 1-epimerase